MQKTLFFLAVVGRGDGSGGELGVETINEGDGGVKESIACLALGEVGLVWSRERFLDSVRHGADVASDGTLHGTAGIV